MIQNKNNFEKALQLIRERAWLELHQYILQVENKKCLNLVKYQKQLSSTFSRQQKIVILTQMLNQLDSYQMQYQVDLAQSKPNVLLQQQQNQPKILHWDNVQQNQIILKAASVLFIQDMDVQIDCIIVNTILSKQQSLKYFFMVYQETYIQLKQAQELNEHQSILRLKFLGSLYIFADIINQKVFQDVVQLIFTFYNLHQQIQSEQLISSTQQINNFSYIFTKRLLNRIFLYFTNFKPDYTKWNQNKIQHVFRLIKFMYSHIHSQAYKIDKKNTQNESIGKDLLDLIDLFVDKLQISCLSRHLPSFYLQNQIQTYLQTYSEKMVCYIFGNCLIRQLPQRPQFSCIEPAYFSLINAVCSYIFKQKNIQDYAMADNPTFIIDLYQRFAILMGFLNKNDQSHKLIETIINNIFYNKSILSESAGQNLWGTLVYKHEEANFKCFCISQYKKCISANTKPETMIKMARLIQKLVIKLQPNENINLVGTIITVVFYFLVSIKKTLQTQKNNNFSETIKNNKFYALVLDYQGFIIKLKNSFQKIKKGLDDRVKVLRQKTNSESANIQNEINEIIICIYRIDQLQLQNDK